MGNEKLTPKDKNWLEKEDWKINAWDPHGTPIIENGKPTKEFTEKIKEEE